MAAACRNPNEAASDVRVLWYARQDGITRSRPAVTGDVVIFASGDGSLVARDAATGRMVWQKGFFARGDIQGADLVLAGDAVVALGLRQAVAFGVAAGGVRWRYEPPIDSTIGFPGNTIGLPGYMNAVHATTDTATVYLPAWGASVSAVDVATGAAKWVWQSRRLPSDTARMRFQSGAVGVALSGDTLFVSVWHYVNPASGIRESMLTALDRATGAQLWSVLLPREEGRDLSVFSAPVVVSSLIIVPTLDGRLFAFDRATRQLVWSFRSPTFKYATLAQPIVYGDHLYATPGDEYVYAIRVMDGSVEWKTPSRGANRDLLVTEKRVYVPNAGLLIYDRATGALIAEVGVRVANDAVETAPAALGRQIFSTETSGVWSFLEP